MGRKFTYEEVKEYIENYGLELLSKEYNSNKDKLLMKCEKGHTFKRTLASFKYSTQHCPHCYKEIYNKDKKLNYNEVKSYVESQGYELISEEYINCDTKLIMKCPRGHKCAISWSNFRSGKRCRICRQIESSNRQKLSYKNVKEYIESQGYELISDNYINNREKILLKCPEGHEFYVRLDLFKVGTRCPQCNVKSHGQKEIENILNKYNIDFNIEYKFDKCRFKYALPFDFYLSDYNICIEFDGRQHYEIVKHFGGLNGFIETKIRDTVKTEYCKNNNIKLIRIPYWNIDNIEEILIKELKIS